LAVRLGATSRGVERYLSLGVWRPVAGGSSVLRAGFVGPGYQGRSQPGRLYPNRTFFVKRVVASAPGTPVLRKPLRPAPCKRNEARCRASAGAFLVRKGVPRSRASGSFELVVLAPLGRRGLTLGIWRVLCLSGYLGRLDGPGNPTPLGPIRWASPSIICSPPASARSRAAQGGPLGSLGLCDLSFQHLVCLRAKEGEHDGGPFGQFVSGQKDGQTNCCRSLSGEEGRLP
jgi:hypothetical protein